MDETKLSPMMALYMDTKKDYPDCLLFYRLGDFYELFFDDAVIASRELELTLTGRSCGEGEKAPMCGVPFHAVENYIDKLVKHGYKVAVCDQMEDPRLVKGGQLVKREVTRVVTPGTNMNIDFGGDGKNNYILCITCMDAPSGLSTIGLAACDITTGEFLATELKDEQALLDEIAKFEPAEIVTTDTASGLLSLDFDALSRYYNVLVSRYDAYHFEINRARQTVLRQFKVAVLAGLGLDKKDLAVSASGALLDYLGDTQKRELGHISHMKTYSSAQYMVLDSATRRNLELTETLRDKERKGSLLWVLDYTKTAMGARELRRFLEQPLVIKSEIDERLDIVDAFVKDPLLSSDLREELIGVYDMERLIGRINYGSVNPRDLVALRQSLGLLPAIRSLLSDSASPHLKKLAERLDTLDDLYARLDAEIADEPPLSLREGGIIKAGYSAEVDKFRSASTDGKGWLTELEARERELTGIKNLRVGYTRVFGYYIEVSKGNVSEVPDRYIRRQTLTTGERFITEELKNMEDTLLGAKERDEALEYDLFCELRTYLAQETGRIQAAADLISHVDALRSLAEAAIKNNYVKPRITDGPDAMIRIAAGRHPVVERMLETVEDRAFIPNDTVLGASECTLALITGPNMAGKSTYMRQVALITLMAQAGSFVPADSAEIALTDHIFTRIGASDDLAGGQSTFMTEMTEVSNILRHATDRSLLILDEIGRGTSTYDGLSIAQAVAEFILHKLKAKTLFATHYHELTALAETEKGLKNYCVAVKEKAGGIVFLHKIQEGTGDQSYGIEVARLAGLPEELLVRAGAILNGILSGEDSPVNNAEVRPKGLSQIELFMPAEEGSGASAVEKSLAELDLDALSPREALEKLYELKKLL